METIIPIPSTRIIDLTGHVYGKLVVLGYTGTHKSYNYAMWLCQCECDNKVVVTSHDLRMGRTTRCGCKKGREETHGLSKHPIYKVWNAMNQRCAQTWHPFFHRYGGRGITVCDQWKDNPTQFIEDMYPTYQPGLHLDRINNDGNYEPSNCRWATPKENMNNRG